MELSSGGMEGRGIAIHHAVLELLRVAQSSTAEAMSDPTASALTDLFPEFRMIPKTNRVAKLKDRSKCEEQVMSVGTKM